MFVFDPNYTFEWPVTVKMPADGGDQEFTFTGVFKMPEEDEIFARTEVPDGSGPSDMVAAARTRLEKYWVGWSGINVKGGGELAYSESARANLLRRREIRLAVDNALFDALIGIRTKN